MINTINHIPNPISIEKLKPYKKDEKIIQDFVHYDIPFYDDGEISELEDSDTFICDTDYVLYSTSNNMEESYLQFHIYDKEEDDFLIHHDILVYSPINDADYLKLGDDHYVAVATYDQNLMLYDALIYNPMTPQILLKGHTEGILSVKNFNNSLYSGSEDEKIIMWDLVKNKIKEKFKIKMKAEKICMSNDTIFCGENRIIRSVTGDFILVEDTIENLHGIDNSLYLTTSSGHFINYDVRNLSKPFFIHKYSESPLTGMSLLNGKIGFCSKDGEMTILDGSDFEIKDTERIKSSLYSLKLHKDNIVFYGDETETLNMKKLRSTVF